MENWGLITYRETALLYDPSFSSNSNKERVATIIAHELAHMVPFWFLLSIPVKCCRDAFSSGKKYLTFTVLESKDRVKVIVWFLR